MKNFFETVFYSILCSFLFIEKQSFYLTLSLIITHYASFQKYICLNWKNVVIMSYLYEICITV